MTECVDGVRRLREVKEGDCVKSEESGWGLTLRLLRLCIPSCFSQGFGNVSIKCFSLGWGCRSVGRILVYHAKSPGFNPQYCVKLGIVTLLLGEEGKIVTQGQLDNSKSHSQRIK